jgi:hypothetical protein
MKNDKKTKKRGLTQILPKKRGRCLVCKRCGLPLIPEWDEHICLDLMPKKNKVKREIVFVFSKLSERDDEYEIGDRAEIENEEDEEDEERIKKNNRRESKIIR